MEVWNIPYSRYCFHDRGWKYRRHKAYRDPQHNGAAGAVDGGQDKGQNSIQCTGGGVGGVPDPAQQELKQANLPNGGQAGDDEVHADAQHKGHSHDAAQQEEQMHEPLQKILRALGLGAALRPLAALGGGGGGGGRRGGGKVGM